MIKRGLGSLRMDGVAKDIARKHQMAAKAADIDKFYYPGVFR